MHNESERRLRVLVADDHDDFRRRIVRLLDPVFDVVAAVATGHELVDAAVALEPDVIVSDLVMPALTGVEALKMLRTAGHTIPFVLQTVAGTGRTGMDRQWRDPHRRQGRPALRPRDRCASGRCRQSLPVAKSHGKEVTLVPRLG